MIYNITQALIININKMIHKKNSGFTLIELLVVIAIIGILSAVVLASLNTARAKGANAAIKSDLHGISSQSNIIYDDASPNSYAGVCADPKVIAAMTHAMTVGGDIAGTVATRCNNIDSEWATNALLKVPENAGADVYWCVDNGGSAKGEANELAGATACA